MMLSCERTLAGRSAVRNAPVATIPYRPSGVPTCRGLASVASRSVKTCDRAVIFRVSLVQAGVGESTDCMHAGEVSKIWHLGVAVNEQPAVSLAPEQKVSRSTYMLSAVHNRAGTSS